MSFSLYFFLVLVMFSTVISCVLSLSRSNGFTSSSRFLHWCFIFRSIFIAFELHSLFSIFCRKSYLMRRNCGDVKDVESFIWFRDGKVVSLMLLGLPQKSWKYLFLVLFSLRSKSEKLFLAFFYSMLDIIEAFCGD